MHLWMQAIINPIHSATMESKYRILFFSFFLYKKSSPFACLSSMASFFSGPKSSYSSLNPLPLMLRGCDHWESVLAPCYCKDIPSSRLLIICGGLGLYDGPMVARDSCEIRCIGWSTGCFRAYRKPYPPPSAAQSFISTWDNLR